MLLYTYLSREEGGGEEEEISSCKVVIEERKLFLFLNDSHFSLSLSRSRSSLYEQCMLTDYLRASTLLSSII